MILTFIIKSSACLAIFMLFYKLLLEKESMHQFKRFYLLAALLVAIIIPFITFTQYIEVTTTKDIAPLLPVETPSIEPLTAEETFSWQDYIPSTLWSIYIIGACIFCIRFIVNLRRIIFKIKTNPKHTYSEFTNVLLQDIMPPHTFFKYIFLNKSTYEQNLIPKEVLLHEQTHAKQKHSLDILLVEALQIFFWFNPLIHLIKKDIKLNHEFLADQEVLKKGIDSAQYKQTLLAFSSSAKHPKVFGMANAINYSLIKKRFTVMKSQTSKKVSLIKRLLILPLLAILIYSFSEKKILEKEFTSTVSKIEASISSNIIKIHIDSERKVTIDNKKISFKKLSKEVNNIAQNLSNPKIIIEVEEELNIRFLKDLKAVLSPTKIPIQEIICETLVLDERENEQYFKQTTDYFKGVSIAINGTGKITTKKGELITGYSGKITDSIGQFQKIELPKKTQSGNSITIPVPDGVAINSEHLTKISEYAKKILEIENKQQKATPEQITEYNTIVKRMLLKPEKQRIIKQKDVERITHLYGLMSNEQKKYVADFPKLVPSPPPPMDTLYTYNSLAKRTKFIPRNRKNNLQHLKKLFSKMSSSQKEKVESPSYISKYLDKVNSLTKEQKDEINGLFNKINTKAQSRGRKFYSPAEYKELEKLYANMLSNKN